MKSTSSVLAVSLGNIASVGYAALLWYILAMDGKMPAAFGFSSLGMFAIASFIIMCFGIWQKLGEESGEIGKYQRRVDFFLSLTPFIPIAWTLWMVSQKEWVLRTFYDQDVMGIAAFVALADIALIWAINRIRGEEKKSS